ncbi:hypothetical protein GGI09_008878, partial [Coemansia sp. S100]
MSPPVQRRLRSRGESSENSTESKFAKLRRIRATGESALSLLKDDDDDDDEMYMKVDEDEYQRRIQHSSSTMNDFVVDDDGAGYVEDGLDDIGGSPSKPAKASKKAAGKAPIPVVKESRRISTMFKNVQLKP